MASVDHSCDADVFVGPVTQKELIITWMKRRQERLERERIEALKNEGNGAQSNFIGQPDAEKLHFQLEGPEIQMEVADNVLPLENTPNSYQTAWQENRLEDSSMRRTSVEEESAEGDDNCAKNKLKEFPYAGEVSFDISLSKIQDQTVSGTTVMCNNPKEPLDVLNDDDSVSDTSENYEDALGDCVQQTAADYQKLSMEASFIDSSLTPNSKVGETAAISGLASIESVLKHAILLEEPESSVEDSECSNIKESVQSTKKPASLPNQGSENAEAQETETESEPASVRIVGHESVCWVEEPQYAVKDNTGNSEDPEQVRASSKEAILSNTELSSTTEIQDRVVQKSTLETLCSQLLECGLDHEIETSAHDKSDLYEMSVEGVIPSSAQKAFALSDISINLEPDEDKENRPSLPSDTSPIKAEVTPTEIALTATDPDVQDDRPSLPASPIKTNVTPANISSTEIIPDVQAHRPALSSGISPIKTDAPSKMALTETTADVQARRPVLHSGTSPIRTDVTPAEIALATDPDVEPHRPSLSYGFSPIKPDSPAKIALNETTADFQAHRSALPSGTSPIKTKVTPAKIALTAIDPAVQVRRSSLHSVTSPIKTDVTPAEIAFTDTDPDVEAHRPLLPYGFSLIKTDSPAKIALTETTADVEAHGLLLQSGTSPVKTDVIPTKIALTEANPLAQAPIPSKSSIPKPSVLKPSTLSVDHSTLNVTLAKGIKTNKSAESVGHAMECEIMKAFEFPTAVKSEDALSYELLNCGIKSSSLKASFKSTISTSHVADVGKENRSPPNKIGDPGKIVETNVTELNQPIRGLSASNIPKPLILKPPTLNVDQSTLNTSWVKRINMSKIPKPKRPHYMQAPDK